MFDVSLDLFVFVCCLLFVWPEGSRRRELELVVYLFILPSNFARSFSMGSPAVTSCQVLLSERWASPLPRGENLIGGLCREIL